MTTQLYPLKFELIIVSKIRGGSKLHDVLGKPKVENAGESWELSGVEGNISVVASGDMKG